MQISVTLPNGSTLSNINCEFDLTRPEVIDRLDPRTMDLTVDRRVPITQFSTITAKDRGMIKFRGYAESNDIDSSDGNKTTWNVVGMEGLLNHRFTSRYFYKSEDLTIEDILRDDIEHNTPPGLLAMANSGVPPGITWKESETVDGTIELSGYGTNSYFGMRDIYCLTHLGTTNLPYTSDLVLPYVTLGHYRDEDNLYVMVEPRGYSWYLHGGLFCQNAYDTTVRLGDVEDAEQTLAGDLETNGDAIGDLIADLVNASGYQLLVLDDDNYTYLSLISDGRGSTNGLYSIVEGEPGFIRLEKSTASDPKVHNVIGIGYGEQKYSTDDDLTWTGIRLMDSFEVENGFIGQSGMFQKRIDGYQAACREDAQYDIEIAKSYQVYPGDYFKFKPMYSKAIILQCAEINETSEGITKLSLGNRDLNYRDIEDARNNFPRGYRDKYIQALESSVSGNETIHVSDGTHISAPSGIALAVPDGILDVKYNPKVILTISLSIADTTSVDRDLGLCSMETKINGVTVIDGNLEGIAVNASGSGSYELDVTDYITEDATNTVKVWVYLSEEYSETHSAASEHPSIAVSATLNFYKRSYV